MRRKLLGGILGMMGAFITAVAFHNHSYWLATMFAIMSIVIICHFFGDDE